MGCCGFIAISTVGVATLIGGGKVAAVCKAEVAVAAGVTTVSSSEGAPVQAANNKIVATKRKNGFVFNMSCLSPHYLG